MITRLRDKSSDAVESWKKKNKSEIELGREEEEQQQQPRDIYTLVCRIEREVCVCMIRILSFSRRSD